MDRGTNHHSIDWNHTIMTGWRNKCSESIQITCIGLQKKALNTGSDIIVTSQTMLFLKRKKIKLLALLKNILQVQIQFVRINERRKK